MKKIIKESEFRQMIQEEAVKLKKIMMLESEKRTLEEELQAIFEELYSDDEDATIDEFFGGVFAGAPTKEAKANLDMFIKNWMAKGKMTQPTPEEINAYWAIAKKDSYLGSPQIKDGKLTYQSSREQRSNVNAASAFTEGENLDELLGGIFAGSPTKEAKAKLDMFIKNWVAKGQLAQPTPDEVNAYWTIAKKDSYLGSPQIVGGKLSYQPSREQKSSAGPGSAFSEE